MYPFISVSAVLPRAQLRGTRERRTANALRGKMTVMSSCLRVASPTAWPKRAINQTRRYEASPAVAVSGGAPFASFDGWLPGTNQPRSA